MKSLICVCLSLVLMSACKPSGADSSLADIATANSLKTGFFMPMLPEDLAYGNPKRVNDPMKLMAAIGLKYTREPGEAFVVATTPESENILVVSRLRRPPAPIASLGADGRQYLWSTMRITDDQSGYKFETNLYIRHLMDQKATRQVSADGNSSNMYFLRMPKTNDGKRETLLINWVDHILAGGKNLLYRVGNIVYMHGAEAPILRYSELGNQVWQMDGAYKDDDVGPGTVFWTVDRSTYYSLNPNGKILVKWRKQDKDSMDRVGRVDPSSVRVPDIVVRNVKAAIQSGGFGLASGGKMSYFGMDWTKLYKGTIPLLQHEAVLKARAALDAKRSQFSLTKPAVIDENSPDFDAFFEPEGAAEGLSLAGRAPGIPLFNPTTGYPYGNGAKSKNNWVQVEQPPGSGIYKVAVVQQQGNQTRREDGWVWDSEVNQRTHKLQFMEPDGNGGYKPNGQVANFTTEGNKFVSRDISHVVMERAKLEANQDRAARAAAQAKEEFAFKSAEGQARMEAAEKSYDKFEKQYTIEENLKYAAGEAIDLGSKKLNAGRPPAFDFQEQLTRDAAKTLTKEGANILIDTPRAIANGEVPVDPARLLDKSVDTVAGSAATTFIPIKLPDGATKAAATKLRSVAAGWASDGLQAGVQTGAEMGYDAITGQVAGDLDGDGQLSASERGRLAGEAGASTINLQTQATQGVLDVGFAAAKEAAKDPYLGVATRVGERGAQIGNQALGTYRQFDGANNAFLEAGAAQNEIMQYNYDYGYEGSRAQNQMEQDFQSGTSYDNPWSSGPSTTSYEPQGPSQPVSQPVAQPASGPAVSDDELFMP